ncbi:MAG: ABC transporter permease [Bdellovibrionales bacterium]|nr:ABC transporter permease [Bdellovibrionales bacterium]
MFLFFKKTLLAGLTVLALLSFTFFLIFLIPGDPVDFILKDGASLEDKNLLRQEMGLDKSFTEQYFQFLKNFLTLNLGQSIHTGESVIHLIISEFPYTFFLSIFSIILAILWGIPLALLSAYPYLKRLENIFNFFPLIFISIPVFVSAPFLIWLFSTQLSWFPVSGAGSFSYLILPSLSLALPLGAILMKISRTSLLEVLSMNYVRTAQSKGLSPFQIYFKHVLKNAMSPILTILGLQMGALLTGTLIVETIFDRPGIGSLLYQAILSRDYPLIQALILLITLIYIFINNLTDILYSLFNPLIKSH